MTTIELEEIGDRFSDKDDGEVLIEEIESLEEPKVVWWVSKAEIMKWFHLLYVLDWIVASSIFVGTSLFRTIASPHEVYFMDGDFSQSYPYQESTVPSWALVLIGISPAVITTIYQLFRKAPKEEKLHEIHHALLSWFEAMAINALIGTSAKFACGRHRPDYFARIGMSAAIVKDSHLSFPSGHSSGSFSAMTFVFWYFCGKTKVFYKGFFSQLVIIAIPLYFALWVAITRVQDYKHNYSDILGGMLLGLIAGTIAYLMNFNSPLSPDSDKAKNYVTLPPNSPDNHQLMLPQGIAKLCK